MVTSRRLSNLAILAVLACAVVYVVALGTHWGLTLDRGALPRDASGPRWERAHAALHVAVESVSIATMALVGGAAILYALRRGRRDLALAAAGILVGANVTAAVLKPLLALADPLGGETKRVVSGAYPSGHATATMSLALVTVLVAPRIWRLWVAFIASSYVAVVGVGLVALVAHQPSDVVGGYLVAVAWAAGIASVAASARERAAPPRLRERLVELGSWGGGCAMAAALVLALLEPAVHFHNGLFAVAALIIAGLALALPVALAVVLGGRPTAPLEPKS
jgi:membrane-associated phospholipid phosphatase